jgi:hypothetical protein
MKIKHIFEFKKSRPMQILRFKPKHENLCLNDTFYPENMHIFEITKSRNIIFSCLLKLCCFGMFFFVKI